MGVASVSFRFVSFLVLPTPMYNTYIESLTDTRTLKKVAPLLRAQRSRRHKNCRIGGLMFDNQRT